MLILITGGSGSGKSAFAEDMIQHFEKPYYYIATMQPFGNEAMQKIARHQRMRRNKGFQTLECYYDVSDAAVSPHGAVLLECMSNLTANVQFSNTGNLNREPFDRQIISQITTLADKTAHLIVVTNEVFSDSAEQYGETTQEYMSVLGRVNCRLAAMADEVYEVVYGIPIRLK